MISGSSVLLHLPRSQRHGARRRPRCRRARSSTSGLRSNTESFAPDSGHTGSLFRLDINLSRWGGRSFLFREARFKQTYADEATPWSPTERRQPFSIWGDRSRRPVPVQGPPPLLLYPSPSVLRSPILGVFTKLADVLVMWPNKSPLVSCHISR